MFSVTLDRKYFSNNLILEIKENWKFVEVFYTNDILELKKDNLQF